MLLLQFGWRSLFSVFGMLGAPLIAFWMATVPDTAPAVPGAAQKLQQAAGAGGSTSFRQARGGGGEAGFRSGPAVSGPSSSSGAEVGVRELLSSSATWAIIIVNIVNHWGYFIYLNWMPSYFNAVGRRWFGPEHHHLVLRLMPFANQTSYTSRLICGPHVDGM